MPKSICLIYPNSITLDSIKDMIQNKFRGLRISEDLHSSGIYIYPNSESEGKYPEHSYVSLSITRTLNDMSIEGYLDCEDTTEEFQESLFESDFAMMQYNYISFCQHILKIILCTLEPTIQKIWIDDDYGDVLEGEKVLANPTLAFKKNYEYLQ